MSKAVMSLWGGREDMVMVELSSDLSDRSHTEAL